MIARTPCAWQYGIACCLKKQKDEDLCFLLPAAPVVLKFTGKSINKRTGGKDHPRCAYAHEKLCFL